MGGQSLAHPVATQSTKHARLAFDSNAQQPQLLTTAGNQQHRWNRSPATLASPRPAPVNPREPNADGLHAETHLVSLTFGDNKTIARHGDPRQDFFMVERRKVTFFFSWQADLPPTTNRGLLADALRSAATRIEQQDEFADVVVHLDEATRDLSGAPNIPSAIFSKIADADVFICDLTTTGYATHPPNKPSPNPNVAIELGFAIAKLGWPRIIIAFNSAYGEFPSDAPFDVDRHRMSDYSFGEDDAREQASCRKGRVTPKKRVVLDSIHAALSEAVRYAKANPRPRLLPPTETTKRNRDVEALTALLREVHIPTLDHFLERLEVGRMPHAIFHYWEGFSGVMGSSLFHIHDPVALQLAKQLHKNWHTALSFGHAFWPHDGEYVFNLDGMLGHERARIENRKVQAAVASMRVSLRDFLHYVRQEFVDIDLRETSLRALTEYRNAEKLVGEFLHRDSDRTD